MSTWILNESIPTTLAQNFDAAPPPWTTVYWGPWAIAYNAGGGGFPTQFLGLKTFVQGTIKDLCLVAEADAPAGMGGVIKFNKGGTIYSVYLVEIDDVDATPIRIQTSTGTKAIRIKT